MAQAKPFLKWVGGKGQLIPQLGAFLPARFGEWKDVTYIEPFVGGGAMLFHMLQSYDNISRVVINDINEELTTCYRTVRDHAGELLERLALIQDEYRALRDEGERKEYFMQKRRLFNEKPLSPVENTSLFIFLNRTCFNGLYRVNKSGAFNVPFGRYAQPTICDRDTIIEDSRLLRKVEIMTGDFEATLKKANGNTLFYFDPPYRPISSTSNFKDYAKEPFDDMSQVRLKRFCDKVQERGYYFMLSNSDGMGNYGNDSFFDDLYADYPIERVWASRSVNAVASKRGKLSEILVHNYDETVASCNENSIYRHLRVAL